MGARRLKDIFWLSPPIWDRLLVPAEHPQFQRTRRQPSAIPVPWVGLIWLAVIGTLAVVDVVQAQVLHDEMNVVYPLLTALVASSSLYVGLWVFQISGALSEVRSKRTYDLLLVLPSGPQGADLAISTACMHRKDALGWIDALRKVFSILLLVLLAFLLLSVMLSMNSMDLLLLLNAALDMILLAIISYTEHVQSVVYGCLIGILAARHSQTGSMSKLWAVSGFLAIQVLTLCLALLMAGLANTHPPAELSAYTYGFSPTAISLLAFHLLRQGSIAILWKHLRYLWCL